MATDSSISHRWPALLAEALASGKARITGARGSALAKCLADARRTLGRSLLLVAPDPEVAGDIHGDLRFYLGDGALAPHFWPAWDILPFETDHPDVEVAADQVAVLRTCLAKPDDVWIVAPITALLQPTLSPKIIGAGGLAIASGTEVSPEAIIAHLVEGGLEPVSLVDAPGQFSRRGGILDVYPLLGDTPYRLEFFGDEIDTVRAFDPGTQQSGPPLDGKITLVDVSRDAFRNIDGSSFGLLDYLPKDTAVVVWHPERVTRVSGLYAGGFSGGEHLLDFAEVAARLSALDLAMIPDLDDDPWPDAPWAPADAPLTVDFGATGWERLSGGFDAAVNELSILTKKNLRLTITCNNEGEEKRLRQMLADKRPSLLDDADIHIGHLSRGFVHEAPGGGEAYVSDHELFGRQSPVRSARKRYAGTPIADFAELREGDYVVHIANGIARFEGMRTLEQNSAEQDFLVLRFAEDARIYVPLSHIDLVQRYIGLGDHKPQLSKLGSAAWNRRKQAVEKAVRDIAQDLIDTQAKRLSSRGIALPGDDALVMEFDAAFPYDDTPDQISAADDIRRDQQSEAPMERLLCGDVGFGKTEMAVRAAFRAVNAGYQAAVLVPTTILAEQHYRTFSQRMADYPVAVECLSRFRGANEQKRIVENLKNGKVDVVIGTHRVLSEDVSFKNLGLVVIDEEQKFGVEAKERLKRFRADVDILTMTATPIPRTLHMSLLGLRDISNLTTPPRERHSVKTMVVRWSKEVVRRAVLRELARGGQCFFLHNRVHNIDEMAAKLRDLVPEARFGIGHGQMAEGELLEVMRSFLDGKIDVLVCTTIIESGVDIPNVNTLFVNQADHFGLSELHQLRGRVGRYKHQAYAYFLVPEKRPISPEAAKRLQALQEYTELGAGFRIAMRDLEIRGAGNLLGVEQSGHIHMIGFDLYCRLLERAVAAQKGEAVEDDVEVELDLGTRAFIPPEYIPAEQQRIEFYRRLTRIRDFDGIAASRDYVRDRYGPVPAPVERCFLDQELRIRMLAAGVEMLGRIDGALAVGFSDKAVRRAVMLLRHAGFKTTPLRKNQWRVEVTGVESSLEPGIQAAGMADKLLSALEAGGAALRAERRPPRREPVAARSTPKPRPEDREENPAEPPPPRPRRIPPPATPPDEEPDSPPSPVDAAHEADDAAEEAGDGRHLAFFSSDMLDAPEAPPRRAPELPLAAASGPEEEAEEAAVAPAKGIKKKKGKSGAAARAKKAEAEARREEAIAGGARKTAKMPERSGKPGIIALGKASAGKPAGALPSPPPAPPAKALPAPERDDDEDSGGKDDATAGVKVLGVELYIANGQIGIVVPETAFNPIRYETMTLLIKGDPEERFFLRCVGMGVSPGRRVVLKLKAKDGEEATRAAEHYLQAGEARLFDGVVE